MNYTKELAEFCSGLSYDAIPREVIHKAKLCLLDYIANIYGSLELKATRAVIEYVRSLGGDSRATALGCGFKTGVQSAAFINGTTAESIEAQDGLRFGGNHPVSAVIPAALAIAEERNLCGKKLLEAIVVGYEIANRASSAMHPFHTLSGFLPTGTCGTFGAAAAVAKMYGLNADNTLNAIGNAGYLLPLSMAEHLMGGYTIKIVQGGQAASAGIMAAGLAENGITGSPFVLEGSALKGGFTQITTKAEPKLERLTDRLGEYYSIMDIYFKPFTACRHTHAAAQATLEIIRQNRINADDIKSITASTYSVALIAVGKGVSDGGSFVSAQFSIPYVVAACILDDDLGPSQITEQRMADPGIMELARRVTVKSDNSLNAMYPDKTAGKIEISLKNGDRIERMVDIPKGDPRDPMEEKDIIDKIKRFSASRRDVPVDEIADQVMNIEKAGCINKLVTLI